LGSIESRKQSVFWNDGHDIHFCEGAEPHPGDFLIWTKCDRDVLRMRLTWWTVILERRRAELVSAWLPRNAPFRFSPYDRAVKKSARAFGTIRTGLIASGLVADKHSDRTDDQVDAN
jgi:hypothetical protein